MKTLPVVLALACVAVVGCKRKLHWSETRATQISAGGFTTAIPAGWREASEATDDDMQKLVAQQPGAHILVKDDFDGATIIVKSADTEPTAEPPCDEIANTVAKQEGATATNIVKSKLENDGVCRWNYKKDDVEGEYWIRFHDKQLFAVMCFAKGTDAAACDQIRTSARPGA